MGLQPDLQLVVRLGATDRPTDQRAGRGVRVGDSAHARRSPVGRDERTRTKRRAGRPPPRLHQRSARELVPGTRNRGRQRGGHGRRSQRPWQLPRVQAQHAPMDDAHHRVRRPTGRRPGCARLDRFDQGDAAQLDRTQRRCAGRLRGDDPDGNGRRHPRVHHATGHPVRRIVHGAGAGTPPGRRAHHPRARLRGRRVPSRGRDQERRRPPSGRQDQDRCVHRLVRHQSDHRRAGAGVDRRLRVDGVRHRGDHGRAVRRRTRLRVRRASSAYRSLRSNSRPRRGSSSSRSNPRTAQRSTPPPGRGRSSAMRRT